MNSNRNRRGLKRTLDLCLPRGVTRFRFFCIDSTASIAQDTGQIECQRDPERGGKVAAVQPPTQIEPRYKSTVVYKSNSGEHGLHKSIETGCQPKQGSLWVYLGNGCVLDRTMPDTSQSISDRQKNPASVSRQPSPAIRVNALDNEQLPTSGFLPKSQGNPAVRIFTINNAR